MKEKLRKFLNNILLVALVILAGYVVILQECSRPRERKQFQARVDSLQAVIKDFSAQMDSVLNLPPDTVWRDSIVFVDTSTHHGDEYTPVPVNIKGDTVIYHDILDKDYLWVSHWIRVHGSVLSAQWNWKIPPRIYVFEEIHHNVPYPIYRETEIRVPERTIYLQLSLGAEFNTGPVVGAGLVHTNRKGNIYGIGYRNFDGKHLFEFEFGKKLFSW